MGFANRTAHNDCFCSNKNLNNPSSLSAAEAVSHFLLYNVLWKERVALT